MSCVSQVLVGTDEGLLQLYEYTVQPLDAHDARPPAGLVSCTLIGGLAGGHPVPVVQLGATDGAEYVFGLWGERLWPLDLSAALEDAALGALGPRDTDHTGFSNEAGRRLMPSLGLGRPLEVSGVLCFCVLQGGRVDGAAPGVARVGAATASAVHVYTYVAARWELDVVLSLAPFPPPLVPCSVSWAGVGALVLCDEAQVHLLPLPPLSAGDAADAHPMPLLRPTEPRDARGAGGAVALPLAMGELLLLGGGAAAVGMHYDPEGVWSGGGAFSLQSGSPLAAALCWPHLLAASASSLRVFDAATGALLQALRLPPPAAPPRSRAAAANGAAAPRVAAFSAHCVLVARGAALFACPAGAGTSLATEYAWLRQAAQRPWDAVLVERHLAAVLAAPRHPLAEALASVSARFETRLRAIVAEHPPEKREAPRELEPGSRQEAPPLDAACAQACRLASYFVRRLQQLAASLFPQLAAGGQRGAAATAHEMLLAVERAGFGAMRRSLVGLITERRSDEQSRYRQLLHAATPRSHSTCSRSNDW